MLARKRETATFVFTYKAIGVVGLKIRGLYSWESHLLYDEQTMTPQANVDWLITFDV
ncbi:MAG: hypothetical protein Fur0022_39000 [Anaerolineales bacterium]